MRRIVLHVQTEVVKNFEQGCGNQLRLTFALQAGSCASAAGGSSSSMQEVNVTDGVFTSMVISTSLPLGDEEARGDGVGRLATCNGMN